MFIHLSKAISFSPTLTAFCVDWQITDKEGICILYVEKLTDNNASARLSYPTLSRPRALCFVNNDTADLGSTVPVCPLGHGPLLSTLVFKWSLETPGCFCPERMNVSAAPTAPWVFFRLPRSRLIHPGFSDQCERQDIIINLFSGKCLKFLETLKGEYSTQVIKPSCSQLSY